MFEITMEKIGQNHIINYNKISQINDYLFDNKRGNAFCNAAAFLI